MYKCVIVFGFHRIFKNFDVTTSTFAVRQTSKTLDFLIAYVMDENVDEIKLRRKCQTRVHRKDCLCVNEMCLCIEESISLSSFKTHTLMFVLIFVLMQRSYAMLIHPRLRHARLRHTRLGHARLRHARLQISPRVESIKNQFRRI